MANKRRRRRRRIIERPRVRHIRILLAKPFRGNIAEGSTARNRNRRQRIKTLVCRIPLRRLDLVSYLYDGTNGLGRLPARSRILDLVEGPAIHPPGAIIPLPRLFTNLLGDSRTTSPRRSRETLPAPTTNMYCRPTNRTRLRPILPLLLNRTLCPIESLRSPFLMTRETPFPAMNSLATKVALPLASLVPILYSPADLLRLFDRPPSLFLSLVETIPPTSISKAPRAKNHRHNSCNDRHLRNQAFHHHLLARRAHKAAGFRAGEPFESYPSHMASHTPLVTDARHSLDCQKMPIFYTLPPAGARLTWNGYHFQNGLPRAPKSLYN